MKKAINWSRAEERARGMDSAELHYAILDCQRAIEAWHPRNGEDPEGNQGYYFDEVSVYRREQARRREQYGGILARALEFCDGRSPFEE